MTTYYLKFDTMKGIIETPENCSLEDVLHTICRSEEIACMYVHVPLVAAIGLCKLQK